MVLAAALSPIFYKHAHCDCQVNLCAMVATARQLMCTRCPFVLVLQACTSMCITTASCVRITGHHTWAVRWTEVQTGTHLHPGSAEKNLLHAPESVKGKGSGLQMATETVSENAMQHHGAFVLLSWVSQTLGLSCPFVHVLYSCSYLSQVTCYLQS